MGFELFVFGTGFDKAELNIKFLVGDFGVGPADYVLAVEKGHGVVAADAFGGGDVGFELVEPTPEVLEAESIADDGIEGGEEFNGWGHFN